MWERDTCIKIEKETKEELGFMQIFVKLPSGLVQTLTVNRSDTVEYVMEMLQDKIPVEEQRMITPDDKNSMLPSKMLQDYNIAPGSTIKLLMRIQGSAPKSKTKGDSHEKLKKHERIHITKYRVEGILNKTTTTDISKETFKVVKLIQRQCDTWVKDEMAKKDLVQLDAIEEYCTTADKNGDRFALGLLPFFVPICNVLNETKKDMALAEDALENQWLVKFYESFMGEDGKVSQQNFVSFISTCRDNAIKNAAEARRAREREEEIVRLAREMAAGRAPDAEMHL